MLAVALNSKGQNDTYNFYYSHIYKNLESDYQGAKSAYQKYTKEHNDTKFFPTYIETISYVALQNDDIDFAFELIVPLIRDYGFNVIEPIAHLDSELSNYYSLLVSKKLYDRFSEVRDSLLPVYLKSNVSRLYVAEKISECAFKDKLLTNASSRIKDSLSRMEYNKEVISNADLETLGIIEKLCKKEGTFINSIDHGIFVSERLSFLLWHILKNPENLEMVKALYINYAEKAYLDGKIDLDFFKMLDMFENRQNSGSQTYGTLSGVPCSQCRNKEINYDSDFNK